MPQGVIKNPRRIYSPPGSDPSLATRVTILENNEYKITYFTEISSSTGTITIPTGATILLDQFQSGADAYVSTIQNSQPTGNFPQTAGGVTVDVSSFDALGNYTLSGTPSSYPVALIYILKIKAIDYNNLTIVNILDLEDIGFNLTEAQYYNLNPDKLLSGGTTTVGTYGGTGTDNDIRVAAAIWQINTIQYSTVINTDFLDITLAGSGLQRYVLLYGDNTNTISKIEGVDSAYAVRPSLPANTVLIGEVLVTDASLGASPDLSGYLLKADKATQADVQIGTNNTLYLTAASTNNVYLKKDPNTLTVTSSATISINSDNYGALNVTALATNLTALTITGTPSHGRELIITIVDNGSARTLALTGVVNYGAAVPTTTVAGKVLTIKLKWFSGASVWGCVGYVVQP